jgi:Zn finger protein HypA/HybF involved in hydrogenase expression
MVLKLEKCPACGKAALDLTKYRSMMVVSADKALFHLTCPRCGSHSVSLYAIPVPLLQVVRSAAVELGAGMGRDA